jgi:hypothetical protein
MDSDVPLKRLSGVIGTNESYPLTAHCGKHIVFKYYLRNYIIGNFKFFSSSLL